MSDPGWKQRVQARYQELKKLGKSFFPYIIFKDTVAVFIIFIAVLILALTQGVELEEVADPTDTTYNPRPEWYFLFLFQALKFFPGSLEAVAAIVLPSLVILFLLLLPWIDRGPKRHLLDRPLFSILGAGAIAGFVALTVMGLKSPLLNPVIAKDPQVLAGRRLYNDLHCSYCHSIQGRGGMAAPDLSTVGSRRDKDWLVRHFQDPQMVTPGSIMPKLNLLPEEIEGLTAFLSTLGGGGTFSPRAPHLFEENCSSCHALDGKGEEIGPDLTHVSTYRDKGYLHRYTEDPKTLNPDATMPGFKETLKSEEIEDLVLYLLSPKR